MYIIHASALANKLHTIHLVQLQKSVEGKTRRKNKFNSFVLIDIETFCFSKMIQWNRYDG